MLCFRGYQRRAVVVLPPDDVWRRRLVQRQEQEGTAIRETSLLKAKGQTSMTRSWVWRCITAAHSWNWCSSLMFAASFTLPEQGEHLDQVMFVELRSDEALELLMHYKEEARRLLPTPPKRKKHRQGSQNRPVHHCGNFTSAVASFRSWS